MAQPPSYQAAGLTPNAADLMLNAKWTVPPMWSLSNLEMHMRWVQHELEAAASHPYRDPSSMRIPYFELKQKLESRWVELDAQSKYQTNMPSTTQIQEQTRIRELEQRNLELEINFAVRQQNDTLKCEIHDLKLHMAKMVERCETQEKALQTSIDENTRLRGELSDMMRACMLSRLHDETTPSYEPFQGTCEDGVSHTIHGNLAPVDDVLECASQDVASNSSLGSSWSWISVGTFGPHCVLPTTLFKTVSGNVKFYLPARQLTKGSHVLSDDDETILEVACAPEEYKADKLIQLCADGATLLVTPDHRVPVLRGDSRETSYVRAENLQKGDRVFVDAAARDLTSVEEMVFTEQVVVLKITFKPDKPVAVFAPPQRSPPRVTR